MQIKREAFTEILKHNTSTLHQISMQLDLFYDTMGEKRFEILEQYMTPSNILSYPRQLYFYTVKLRVSIGYSNHWWTLLLKQTMIQMGPQLMYVARKIQMIRKHQYMHKVVCMTLISFTFNNLKGEFEGFVSVKSSFLG